MKQVMLEPGLMTVNCHLMKKDQQNPPYRGEVSQRKQWQDWKTHLRLHPHYPTCPMPWQLKEATWYTKGGLSIQGSLRYELFAVWNARGEW